MNRILNKLVKCFLCAVLISQLFSCGGTGQDDGTPSTYSQNYSGLVIDGYVARATVFIDTNNDGARNAWEPFAFTDDQGYFSYNPVTDTDYCAADAIAEQAQYCLNTNVNYSDAVIRIDSGYDVLTGEPFSGQLSRRINIESADTLMVVSPLTSMLSNVSLDSDKDLLLSALGIGEEDLDVDYLNTDGSGEINEPLLNTALKIHKVVSILGDNLTDTYDEIGDEVGTPYDATAVVYHHLANQLISSQSPLGNLIGDNGALLKVLDSSEDALRDLYKQRDLSLPQDLGSASNSESFNRVIEVVQGLSDIIDVVVDVDQGSSNIEEVKGQVRAVESVVIKALSETAVDSSLDSAIHFFTDEANSFLVDALLDCLESETSDVASLASNDFTGSDFDSEEEVVRASTLSDSAEPFTAIGGLQIRISDLDLGAVPNDLRDAEIELYFFGESGDVSGVFSACAKYIDGANIDGSLGEGNTRGELVDGFWSLLGAVEGDVKSYSLLLTINFLGTTYQAIMKPNGTETIGETEYNVIRFDSDGDIASWHSEKGLVEMESVPNSDLECQNRLPSRIGL